MRPKNLFASRRGGDCSLRRHRIRNNKAANQNAAVVTACRLVCQAVLGDPLRTNSDWQFDLAGCSVWPSCRRASGNGWLSSVAVNVVRPSLCFNAASVSCRKARVSPSYQLLVPWASRGRNTTQAHDDLQRAQVRHHRSAVRDARRHGLCCYLVVRLGAARTQTPPPPFRALRRSAPCLAGLRRQSAICLACVRFRSHRPGRPTSGNIGAGAPRPRPLPIVTAARQGAERRFATSAGVGYAPRARPVALGLPCACRRISSAPPCRQPILLGQEASAGAAC